MYNENHKTFICRSRMPGTDANGAVHHTDNTRQTLHLPELNEVRIEDAFWSPKLRYLEENNH